MLYFQESALLVPPVKRAAYSDRTAWVMAELSRLVYERLPNEKELDALLDEIKKAIANGLKKEKLISLVSEAVTNANQPSESRTKQELDRVNFELFNSYSEGGTECMVVKISKDQSIQFEGMFIIVFRGTQSTSIADLKSDFDTKLIQARDGGRIHKGFYEAFQRVEHLLNSDIQQNDGLPVYITGHSLGGALAMVATRYLASDSIGATYTFGAPRVADDKFYEYIKTPIYRIVNAADGVARVPFGAGFSLFLSILRLLPINGTKQISEWFRKYFKGFAHHGNLTMLGVVPAGAEGKNPYANLKVYKSPSIFITSGIVVKRMLATFGKAALSDHSMDEYSEKLRQYAIRRNY